ncbi:MAG: dihydropteroate synthase [Clostridia bacterium]|nr:dihydropteroate synthase [Clostridia bacterium]
MGFNLRLLSVSTPGELADELAAINVSPEGIRIMEPKGDFILVKVEGLSPQAANILKQEMLAKGGEVAVSWEHARLEGGHKPAIIMGTRAQYERLLAILPLQPFDLPALAEELRALLDVRITLPAPLTIKGKRFDWGERTYIMGIINLTPDSFSGDGLLKAENPVESALRQAEKFLDEGADILDLGGESTRPQAAPVPVEEEKRRILPVVEALAKHSPLPLSVDTYKASVAQAALEAGADIINDVWGLQFDPEMAAVVARFQAPVIVMHNKTAPGYQDLMGEIAGFLRQSINLAEAAGLPRRKVIIDPGVGFGKTREDNLKVIARLGELKSLGAPILLGTSRKSVIGLTLGLPVTERLEGTAATVAVGISRGADLIRVHDVKEMVRVARMTDALVRTPVRD